MKKSFRNVVLMTVMVGLLLAGTAAHAVGLNVEPYVNLTIDGVGPKEPDEFVFELTADKAGTPMPASADASGCRITMTGAGRGDFGPITYDHVGVYNYTIKQIPGSNPDCIYDETVYQMKVTVTNNGLGGLQMTVTLHLEGDEMKPDNPLFINAYKEVPPTPTPTPPPEPEDPPKTGVHDNWPYYVAGCAAMLFICGLMAKVLLRKDNDDEKQ